MRNAQQITDRRNELAGNFLKFVRDDERRAEQYDAWVDGYTWGRLDILGEDVAKLRTEITELKVKVETLKGGAKDASPSTE